MYLYLHGHLLQMTFSIEWFLSILVKIGFESDLFRTVNHYNYAMVVTCLDVILQAQNHYFPNLSLPYMCTFVHI